MFSTELQFADAPGHAGASVRAVPPLHSQTCWWLGEIQRSFLCEGVYKGMVPHSALDLERRIL